MDLIELLTSLWIFLFRCCFLTQECWHMNLTFHGFQIIQQRRFFLGFSFCFVIGAIFFFGFFSFFFGWFFFLGFFLFAFFLVFRFTFIFFFAWRKRSLFIFRNSELYFIHLPKLKKDDFEMRWILLVYFQNDRRWYWDETSSREQRLLF